MRIVLILFLGTGLSACATTGDRAQRDPQDPLEGFNRGVWAFNDALDTVAVKPVTKAYRTVTPVPARRGLSRVLANLSEPYSFVNNLLQGKPKRAFNSLGRFLINTTIGVGGLADHATDLGLPDTREDFGQTLAAWGAKDSTYLVLPLIGPSTLRDGIGTAVQFVADPAQIVINSELSRTQRAGVTGLRIIDARSQAMEAGVDGLLDQAADPYATARSAYLQRRRAQIEDEGVAGTQGQDADQLLQDALDEEIRQAADPPADSQPKQ